MPHFASTQACFGYAQPVRIGSQPTSRLCRKRVPCPVRVRRRCASWRATADHSVRPASPVPAAHAAPAHLSRRSIARSLNTLWRFSRPHTIWGTVLAVLSLHVSAWRTGAWVGAIPAAQLLLEALAPALLLNVFIVGLNQLYDIDIDRINKPNLPLPAGRLSVRDAWCVVLTSLVLGLAFCAAPFANTALRTVLIGSTVLGAAYSAPPFRLKRWPVLSSACILAVRGVLINACFYLHAMRASTAAAALVLPPLLRFAVAFFVLFGIVIALLKDVPDIHGDRVYGIRTFSVRAGPESVFRFCVGALTAAFAVAAAFFWRLGAQTVLGRCAAVVQLVVAAALVWRARGVDPADGAESYAYYMWTWKAFYLQYVLLPIAL